MTTAVTNHTTPRRALLLDAAASGTMGLLLLVGAGVLAAPFGLPASLLRWTGIILIPFAGLLVHSATRADVSPDAVRWIVRANVAWAVGTPLLLLTGWVRPTLLGELFVLLQAVAVAGFAYLERRALQQALHHDRGRPRPATSGTGSFGGERGR